jgi:magnesium chelatase family protein
LEKASGGETAMSGFRERAHGSALPCPGDVRKRLPTRTGKTTSWCSDPNVLRVGPPGSGKTMLAKRLPTLLPPLAFEETLEVCKPCSICGLLPPG